MVTTENGIIKPKTPELVQKLAFVRADELNSVELENPFYIVENILPTGLALLVSPPKYGKSWYSLDLCISVATGTKFIGFNTIKSDVLYLALEDSNNRLQERMRKVLNGRTPPKGMAMSISAEPLDHGLIDQLTQYIRENPETKLIVIDTFQKIRGSANKGESAYSTDYRECSALKTFADKEKICLLLVHHMRKMRDVSDTFANISGTAGITGAADTMIVMSKEKREDINTKLSLTGRDVEMQDYQIQFNKTTCRWSLIGTAEEVEKTKVIEEYNNNPLIQTIRQLLKQYKEGWSGSASELISASRYLKVPIRDTAQKVGKEIEKQQDMLFQQDNIIYTPIRNGSGAKKHSFCYGFDPFTDANR